MIDIDKIEEVAKRHDSDADWQGAAIAYQTHVTPSDVLELVGLIRSQEVALKISHEKFDAEAARCKAMSDYAEQLKSEMAAVPAQTGMPEGYFVNYPSYERKAFEAWAQKDDKYGTSVGYGTGRSSDSEPYTEIDTEAAWQGWKERSRLPLQQMAAIVCQEPFKLAAQPVQQPAPVEDERAAFEQSCHEKKIGRCLERSKNDPECYDHDFIDWRWDGWKARAALAAPVAAPVAWTAVEAALPQVETDVLVRGKRGDSVCHDVAGLFQGEWLAQGSEKELRFIVSHWMPLPALAAHPANVAQPEFHVTETHGTAVVDAVRGQAKILGKEVREYSIPAANVAQVGELSADAILGYAREVGILGPVSDGNALKYARLILAAAKKGGE